MIKLKSVVPALGLFLAALAGCHTVKGECVDSCTRCPLTQSCSFGATSGAGGSSSAASSSATGCTPSGPPPSETQCNDFCQLAVDQADAVGCSSQLSDLASCESSQSSCDAKACAGQQQALEACQEAYCKANPKSSNCLF